MRGTLALISVLVGIAVAPAAQTAEKPTRLWNLTLYTVSELYLAPAGSEKWSKDQTDNEEEGTVEHDERMEITGVENGSYDVKFTDVIGRSCVVKGVNVEVGKIFRIEESDLKDCKGS